MLFYAFFSLFPALQNKKKSEFRLKLAKWIPAAT